MESDVPFDLSASTVWVQGVVSLPLPLSGRQTLTIGKARNGQIPAVIRATAVQFDAIDALGVACVCVRGVVAKTCGGTFFEADGVTLSPDCTQDDSVCAGKNPCTFLHGPNNVASGTIGCDGLDGVNVSFTQDAGGRSRTPSLPVITVDGIGGPGSAVLLDSIALGVTLGACTGTGSAYGKDGEFCTDDDPQSVRGTPLTLPFTTGTATAEVLNANGQDGVDMGPTSATGTPFSCTALAHADVAGTGLATAFAQLHVPVVGDTAAAALLVTQPGPSPPPASPPLQCCKPMPGADVCVPEPCAQ
jgi:hypothetical protein